MLRPGTHPTASGTRFVVRAPDATAVWLCLFDGEAETRVAMERDGEHWLADVASGPGTRYGYRADGVWDPVNGLWFDPAKLLVDPYAIELDRRFAHDPRLAIHGEDTAALVPKAIVTAPPPPHHPSPPLFAPGGLIYELNVRSFTMLHPDVPAEQRGTIAALTHPAIVAHLQKIGVAAVELMPIVAWIDERHLPALGLVNAWGYNPVVPMAIDPGLAPGGVAELRATVATLRANGIGVILDLVFNHSGESDALGPTLSLRGLDHRGSYTHAPGGTLVNDTGTGNTLDCSRPHIRALILETLRHFARVGVDGFRFDLAPVLARSPGFDPRAPIFAEIAADPLIASRIMIAEPWDIGPGGYQLGAFPDDWLEWNDRYRDDVRRFWRGDGHAGALATRMAGSADVFRGTTTRSVNFIAAHDGFTLADTVSYEHRHNEANGEGNRDGHGENLSWNCGAEGPTDDPAILARRTGDIRALLATLFASTGTVMLSAGDEFGRTQQGNNNAYAQDNAIAWVDWTTRDGDLEDFVASLAALRRGTVLDDPAFPVDADWRDLSGLPMTPYLWDHAEGFELRLRAGRDRMTVRIDRRTRQVSIGRGQWLDSV